MQDPYATLGVQRSASPDDIKKAYRALSKEWHPDKHKGDKKAEDRFKEINQAYEVLSDPQKKSQYDRFGAAGNGGGFGGGGFDFSGFAGGGGAGDLEDLFGAFFGGARAHRAEGKGQDLETHVEVTFAEVLTGAERTVRLRRLLPCDACGGSGSATGTDLLTCDDCGGTGTVVRQNASFFGVIEQRVLCARCGGSGKVPKHPCMSCSGEGRQQREEALTLRIPPGVQDGQTLRVKGGGAAGRRGAQGGDLFVHVRVAPRPGFERDGDDVHSTVSIHVLQAMLGDEVEVETVHGPIRLHIPAATQPGQVLRIKGKGLPVLSSSRFGSHFVHIAVDIPTKLSKAERTILEEWKRLR